MGGPIRPGHRHTTRTFAQTLRRATVMPMIGFAAAAAWMTGHAIAPSVPGLTDLAVTRPPASTQLPANQPEWTPDDSAVFPDCHGRVPGASVEAQSPVVVVVQQDAERRATTWAAAWDVTHDRSRANDVWVIGDCPSRTPGQGVG